MQITFIRHLPTEWNKKKWLQGKKDIGLLPITEVFQKEITKNQKLLIKLLPFDVVLASGLKRTQQTAHVYGYEPETEDLLNEFDFGPFEGLPKQKLIEHYGKNWIENPKELVLGESIKSLEERIILFLERYKSSKNILVFGHGTWIRAVLSYHRYGHINNLNKMIVENNDCITLFINSGGLDID
ncbi:histidine phosphatase family protein [Lederbergia citrea]|uniref:Histidine phosphatase family protein n=1 Tax=Lederbergia citrea TaxID=2833581 RepID=A0A942UIA3_9BACI|nr:histidine phosphatase family protein [Lederbergia citrea]MBS4176787.1 histidine phosphatase family protein [Lederbergia citrea]MBS4203347.1 histidine phosphatase family protein [Lederbergia citrea]MBS4221980.1 histidine phosphatase family protein [Lederbergia citrea]